MRTAKDLRGVLDYTTELLGVEQYAQVAPTMLAGLADVVGGDTACLTHLDLDSQHQVAIRWPPLATDHARPPEGMTNRTCASRTANGRFSPWSPRD